jgi:hypothetical protein
MHAIADAKLRNVRLLLFLFDRVDDAVHKRRSRFQPLVRKQSDKVPLLLRANIFSARRRNCKLKLDLSACPPVTPKVAAAIERGES